MTINMKYKGISIVPDSSVISRIVESPSERDSAEKKNRQDKSIGWFKTADEYRVLIPETAANEVATGVHENATKRIKLIRDLPRLAITPEIEQLAKALIDGGAFRPTAKKDALILATACFYGIDYLLTWNMQDLDNNKNKECMARIVQLYGYHLPIICSPKVFSDTHEETPKPEFTALNAEEKSVEDATVYYGKMSYNIDVMKGIDNMEDILHKGTSMPAAEKFALISEKICADFDKDARKVFNDVLGYDMDSGKKIICPVHIPRWAPKSLLSHRKRLKKGIVRSEVLKEIIG
ncbi:MAG: type II toxin-antitoxin system VapC family toxin, partial [Candidatus Portiera sp.]|nr:type II toxin-antitoxin system VapC family toxin [Portiera sp.]